MFFFRLVWWINPDGGRDLRWFWRLADEALWRAEEFGIQGFLACGVDTVGLPEVDLVGGHQADTSVMMVFVVPCEEPAAEGAGLVDGFEAPGEFRLILHRFEVGFRERVVVRGVRSAVRFDHAEIGQHQGRRLCLHRTAAICVQGQLIARHGMFLHRVDEQFLELGGAFRVLDAPANHPAAEDVEDDIEVEVGLFHRPHQLGDIP